MCEKSFAKLEKMFSRLTHMIMEFEAYSVEGNISFIQLWKMLLSHSVVIVRNFIHNKSNVIMLVILLGFEVANHVLSGSTFKDDILTFLHDSV